MNIGIFTVLAVIVAITIFITFIRCTNYRYNDFGDWIIIIFCALLFSVMGFVGTGLLGFIPHKIWGKKTIVEHKMDIVAVHDQSNISGSAGGFLVLSCRIDETDYYAFYHKTGTNSYEKTKIKADETVIHEVKDAPVVKWQEKETYSKIWLGEGTTSKMIGKHHLYIPEGSIQREFILR